MVMVTAVLVGAAAGGERFSGDGTTVVDGDTGLVWTQKSLEGPKTFSVAEIRCGKLELAGRSDWRLPTRAELATLVDLESEGDLRIHEPFELSTCCAWSSEAASADKVWMMDYDYGREAELPRKAWGVATVLCVAQGR